MQQLQPARCTYKTGGYSPSDRDVGLPLRGSHVINTCFRGAFRSFAALDWVSDPLSRSVIMFTEEDVRIKSDTS